MERRRRKKSSIEFGEERGEERGEKRGIIKANLITLKNIMSAQNWPPEKALTFMGIEKSESPRYLALLQN